MPYLYALAEQNARTGDPILRPVFYDYPAALSSSCDESWTFTLGRALLVSPPPSPESPQPYKTCLPAGGWFDYWTGLPAGRAQQQGSGKFQSASDATGEKRSREDVVEETPRLDHLPVYVRAGTILPRQAVVQSTAETPRGPLQLDVYPGRDCAGEVYLDDGHSMGYQRGEFLRQAVRCTATLEGVTLDFGQREGSFKPWWKQVAVIIHGWQGKGGVRAGERLLPSQLDAKARTLRFTLEDDGAPATIAVRRD
jgi:alpha-glucosidase